MNRVEMTCCTIYESRLDIDEYIQNHISVADVFLEEVRRYIHIYRPHFTMQTSVLSSELLLISYFCGGFLHIYSRM